MSEMTLKSLAQRVVALEAAKGSSETKFPPKDWRKVVGMSGDRDFMRVVDEECR